MIPQLNVSTFIVYPCFLISSGAAYPGDPHKENSFVLAVKYVDNPKSTNLKSKSFPKSLFLFNFI